MVKRVYRSLNPDLTSREKRLKFICGVKSSGKSVFARYLVDQLLGMNVTESSILYLNKESHDNDWIVNNVDLSERIDMFAKHCKGTRYVILDGMEVIEHWEGIVRGLLSDERYMIYVTSSCNYVFRSEYKKDFERHAVYVPVYPLSFDEYLKSKGLEDMQAEGVFWDYLKFGGFPGTLFLREDEDVMFKYLNGVLDSILLRFFVEKLKVRNIGMIREIFRYVFKRPGHVMAAKVVRDHIRSQKMRVGNSAVQQCLEHLVECCVLHKVPRYDIKQERVIQLYEKYYLVDTGFKHAVLGAADFDEKELLENVVFLELKRRGYEVQTGRLGEMEIDFIARKEDKVLYIQVAQKLETEQELDRELLPLLAIRDNHQKFIISTDRKPPSDYKGVHRFYILDFLLRRPISKLGEADASE